MAKISPIFHPKAYIKGVIERRAREILSDTLKLYIDNNELARRAAAAHAGGDESMIKFISENSMLIPPMKRALASFANGVAEMSPVLNKQGGK
jgi:hypothetical protein